MKTIPNPVLLKWARERSKISIDQLADMIKQDPDTIRSWEAGEDAPTYAVLESLAYSHLKVPLAIFYFPIPPEMDDPVEKFRRLPGQELRRLSPNTLQMIRRGQAYQDSLLDLLGRPQSERIFEVITGEASAASLAQRARKHLGITLEQQVGFGDCERAFKAWRRAIQQAGVFTFKDALKDRFISGFSLMDKYYPIIMVNNSTAFARQVFTLAHELGHILYGVNGVTDSDEAYMWRMSSQDQALEVACNNFAAQMLVPDEAFEAEVPRFRVQGIAAVESLAGKYSVSREVILRKCLDRDLVTQHEYEEMAEKWNRDYLRSSARKQGGNYYLTRLAYLGEGFVRVAFDQFRAGRVTKTELAGHLNMNARHLKKLQGYLGW